MINTGINALRILDQLIDKPPALFGLCFCLSKLFGRNALIGRLEAGTWSSGPNTESRSKRLPW